MKVRVRFAPSPTGYLHVGGARTALFNWLFARHHGGTFILRIEDTDQARNRWEAVEQILDSMAWLGMAWDEGPLVGGDRGPYFQSARLDLYRQEAERLRATGRAYACFCPPEELAARREEARASGRAPRYSGHCRDLSPAEARDRARAGLPGALRFRVPPGTTRVADHLHGEIVFDNAEMDDFIIMRSDGLPTYNFGAVVDDAHMEITHVIRGDDHLSNTPRQMLLYEALGCEPPRFVHVPQILGPDKTKLSKRHGATGVADYRSEGFVPEALMCYLARLGWSYDDRRELFTTAELVELFDLDRLGKTPAVFDREKLLWVNGRYLKALEREGRSRFFAPFAKAAGILAAAPPAADWERFADAVELMGERVRLGRELPSLVASFFRDPDDYDPAAWEKVFSSPDAAGWLEELAARLERVEPFQPAALEEALRRLAEDRGIRAKDLIHPARLAVTGLTVGASLFETLALVGREATVSRLRRVAGLLRQQKGT